MQNAREVALKILLKAEKQAYSNLIINSELSKSELSDTDKSFITQLVYGVVSKKITLDYIISSLSKIKIDRISKSILNILRMGLYQIYYLDKVPVSAACNEGVNLAKKYGHKASSSFVNAILRNASKKNINEFFDDIKDIEQKLSVKYSHPLWMGTLWIKKFGVKRTEKLLIANNSEPVNCIRVNTMKITRKELIKELLKEGFKVKEGKVEDIIYIENTKKLLHSKYFSEGYFIFQDEAPALVAHLLNPKPEENILDMCSAPGGKTTHIAQLTEDKGKITAWDIHPNRAKLVEDLAVKMEIKSIKVEVADATVFNEELVEKFDKILADVPCSGLGVIRRKPDIKWNTKEEDIDSLNKIQKKILENASRYLKIGGLLIYSTCTNTDEENISVIKKFLDNHNNFIVERVNNIPECFKSGIKEQGFLELSPDIEECDGFFICLLRKIEK